jgi:hypothetical protein
MSTKKKCLGVVTTALAHQVVTFSSFGLILSAGHAQAYARATIVNRALYPASVTINYPGCRNDTFMVPAASMQNGKLVEGSATAPTYRGGCLISWISAQLSGSNASVQNYTSSGTGYSNFIIQPSGSGYRVYSNQELAAENSQSRQGKSPGFYITNKTNWPVSVALEQVGCLYYGTIKPGESFNRDTGAVWFTIKANIQPDGKEPRTDWDCVKPVAAVVGTIIAGAATAGAAAWLAAPAVAAGSAAAALAPIATSNAVIIGSAAAGGGAVATLKMGAEQIGQALQANSAGELKGQYAGYEWPFRCDQKPTYEIRGGWGRTQVTVDGNYVIDKGTPLQIVKTNDCGKNMM